MSKINLHNNDTTPKDFIRDGRFHFEVTFTEWTHTKMPIQKQTFKFISEKDGKKYKLKKALLCRPSKSPGEADCDLILYICENDTTENNPLEQTFDINISLDENMRCVLIVYTKKEVEEKGCPEEDEIICGLYPDFKKNVLIPEVHDGNILVGKN